MSRSALIRLLLVLGLLGACLVLALNKDPRLGIDLRGGGQLQYQAYDEQAPGGEVDPEKVDRTIEVLRGRVDSLGVSESTITRVGDNRILVELPDVQDLTEAKSVLGKTAQLTMHPVVKAVQSAEAKPAEGNQIVQDEDGSYLELAPPAVRGDQIDSADAVIPEGRVTWEVSVDFDGEGSRAYEKVTGEAACNPPGDPKRRIAIVLDGRIISSPQVDPSIGCNAGISGGTNISGDGTQDWANELATLIEGGALPLTIGSPDEDGDLQAGEPLSERVIGPTLGEDAIDASWKAGLVGLCLTGLFILLVYRMVGFLASLALASYALLAYAMLLLVGATLTLPGLAGFVLAIGLAIDANVLVFERAKEEYADAPRQGMRQALKIGFNKAWSAIIDSNVTTLLAAGLLFLLASGPVKGFGVTLSIGVVASMVSALVIARVLTEIGVSTKLARKHPDVTGLSHLGRVRQWIMRKNPDLMKRRLTWIGVSLGAVALALIGVFATGVNLGLEFTGGRMIDINTSQAVDVEKARDAVADAGYPTAVVQETDAGNIAVRTGTINDEEQDRIIQAVGEVSGGATLENSDKVQPTLGSELRQKALIAFGVALLAQMIYLAVRFKWTFGIAAVVAMFHDVLIVFGIFAWLDKPVDGVFLAAALTVIGLSVNDTVVVFDRIRERWWGTTTGTFAEVANKACLETVPRTVNTGLGAMFILAALAVIGGDSLRDFAIALLIGLVVGTYSSVFTATPILTYLQEKWPMAREKRERLVRDPEDSGAVV
jgi:SecD/SecF fusion protein